MAKPYSKFRTTTNQPLIKQLFYEECYGQDEKLAVYTLKDWDHEGYPSLYRLYMETADLTEYTFAETYLDGWAHWERLTQATWFKPFVARWRAELELKLRAQALNRIRKVAETEEHKSAYEANKYLLSGSWKPPGHSKGRPSKDQIKAEATKIAEQEKQLELDAERILQ